MDQLPQIPPQGGDLYLDITLEHLQAANDAPAESLDSDPESRSIPKAPGPLIIDHFEDSGLPSLEGSDSSPSVKDVPIDTSLARSHGDMVLNDWDKLAELLSKPIDEDHIIIDGKRLDIASVVANARWVQSFCALRELRSAYINTADEIQIWRPCRYNYRLDCSYTT
jgi:hypothetical protein